MEDQDTIKKRFSQIEDDINNMNKMIDDNLQIYETASDKQERTKLSESIKEESETDGQIVSVTPQQFSEVTASVADAFIKKSMLPDAEKEAGEGLPAGKPEEPPAGEPEEPPAEKSVENPATLSDKTQTGNPAEVSMQQVSQKPQDIPFVEALPTPPTSKDVATNGASEDIRTRQKTPRVNMPVSEDAKSEATVDQSTSTSEDFRGKQEQSPIESALPLISSPTEPIAPIFLPKNNTANASTNTNAKTPPSTPTTPNLRRPTNPFRVVSVGSSNQDNSSRKSSTEVDGNCAESSHNTNKVQLRLDYLTKKCSKLQREISYLQDMSTQTTLTIDDKKKLLEAINKLQEYLDSKTKEKYELGVQLSRQLRKEIDRGENGQFWVGTK